MIRLEEEDIVSFVQSRNLKKVSSQDSSFTTST